MDTETLRALGLGDDVVFQPNVRYLTPEQAATATISPEALTFPKQDNPWTQEVGEDYIVWSPQGLTWEETFARRVVGVEDHGESVTFRTREAALDDIFASVSYSAGSPDGFDESDDFVDRPETDWSLEELADALDAFFPDTLAGLPIHEIGTLEFDAAGGELIRIDAKWTQSDDDPNGPSILLVLEEANPRLVERLPNGRWYETMQRSHTIYEQYPRRYIECPDCYGSRGGSIERVVFDKYQIRIDGLNVDVAVLQAALEELDFTRLANGSGEHAAQPMNLAETSDVGKIPPPISDSVSSTRATQLRNVFPYRLLGLPRAGRVVIRGTQGEPMQARGVWSEDPFDPSSPYLLVKITDQSSQGRRFDEPWGGPDWEYWPYGDYSGSERTWPSAEIDEEDHPDHELAIFVPDNDGFAIHIEAYNVDIEQLYRVPDAFDLDYLESLVTESRTEVPN